MAKPKHKFKKGDKVKVIANETMHGYEIGETIRILACVDNGNHPFYNSMSLDNPMRETIWAVADEELEELS